MTEKTSRPVRTTCPYCGVGCGILATPQPGGGVDIQGDPDHPANFGRLCSKGSALGETIDMDGRLLFPEVNNRRASWDDALDLVASTFQRTIKEHGPESVAFYLSGQILTEDYYVANKLMKGFIGTANIDTNSRLCMASSVAGHRRAFGSDTVPGVYEDLELADLVVLTGSNLVWCHPVLYQRIAAAKAANPHMKIVVIDPRRTMTAGIADIHLAIHPDSDVALFMGLLAHIAENGFTDRDYIANHTNGFGEALEVVHSISTEEIVRRTGLSAINLQSFYSLWAKTEKVVTVYSQGVNQSATGSDKVNAIINCHLATARIGKPGMGPFSVTGQPNAMGGREVGGLANLLAAHMEIENPVHRNRVQRFWRSPTIVEKPGLKAVDMFNAVGDGRVKAIWIMATNPVDSMPDSGAVESALRACPFVVVSDIAAETDTVRHAHVKLPSLGWGEKAGTVTNSERRMSRQRSFLPAPGEARADWWQLVQVARRMGFQEAFGYRSGLDILREYAALTGFENDGTRDLDIGALAELNTPDLEAMQPLQWPQPDSELPQETDTRFFADGAFFTPDRKARFVPVTVAGPASEAVSGFILNTGRIRDHWHTMTRTAKSSRLSAHIAEPFVEIHPDDAVHYNISDADLVRVSNERGEIVIRAQITERQQRGNIFVPMHWTDQLASAARVDRLVAAETDPVSGQPALKFSRVSVNSFPVRQYGFLISTTRPDFEPAAYWAVAMIDGGWRAEFALDAEFEDMETGLCKMLGIQSKTQLLAFADEAHGLTRYAAFDGNRLEGVVYLSKTPVAVARNWAGQQLCADFSNPAARWRVVAGRPANDMPDMGPTVCSCMNVGLNEITAAIRQGCRSIEAVGERTNAGTNCGSCQTEIRMIIDEHQIIAAE